MNGDSHGMGSKYPIDFRTPHVPEWRPADEIHGPDKCAKCGVLRANMHEGVKHVSQEQWNRLYPPKAPDEIAAIAATVDDYLAGVMAGYVTSTTATLNIIVANSPKRGVRLMRLDENYRQTWASAANMLQAIALLYGFELHVAPLPPLAADRVAGVTDVRPNVGVQGRPSASGLSDGDAAHQKRDSAD